MIWIVILLTGLANFAARISLFSGLIGPVIPNGAEKYLAFVPTSVLSAIIAAALFTGPEGPVFELSNPRLIAALLAALVALFTRSVIATLSVGLGFLWFL